MIQLKKLINEAGDFTAKSKESGKIVHFKSKDSYEKAIKAGSHEDPNKDTSKGDDSKSGVNIFNTPSKEEPKSEPTKDSTQQRAGKSEVNKAVRKKASSLGITPAKLGKEEYQMKMAQAAIEALTDSNYHSEARALIAALEGKPEWAEKPTDMPDMSSPKYAEWRKNSVYSSKYYDADDATQELGTSASQESGWDGQDALDAIAFDLKMNGYKDFAAKLQSVIKEGKRTSLKNLIK